MFVLILPSCNPTNPNSDKKQSRNRKIAGKLNEKKMSGLAAFCGSVGLLVGIVYVLVKRICALEKTNAEHKCRLDNLKRELEEMKQKE